MDNLLLAEDLADAVKLLEKYNYCSLQSTNPKKQEFLIKQIISDFKNLVGAPPEFRSKWEIDHDNDGEPDDGLIERNGGQHDHKFFFHYKDDRRITPFLKQRLNDFKKWELFLRRLGELHQILYQHMMSFVIAFDQVYPRFKLPNLIAKQPKDSRAVLRLLYYKPGFDMFAKHHYDQSLFTFHVADSHPGLVMNGNNNAIYIPQNNNLLIFPGIKMEILSRGKIKGGYHGVVNNNLPNNIGRWSIVFFFHCDIGLSSRKVSEIAKDRAKIFHELNNT